MTCLMTPAGVLGRLCSRLLRRRRLMAGLRDLNAAIDEDIETLSPLVAANDYEVNALVETHDGLFVVRVERGEHGPTAYLIDVRPVAEFKHWPGEPPELPETPFGGREDAAEPLHRRLPRRPRRPLVAGPAPRRPDHPRGLPVRTAAAARPRGQAPQA